jgi:hypothetical protein
MKANVRSGKTKPAGYAQSMDLAKTNDVLSLMTPEEIEDGLWFVDACERNGSMSQAEADEWRRLSLLLTPSALSTLNLCSGRSTMASMMAMIPEGLLLAFRTP